MTKPIPIPPKPDCIPEELRNLKHWVIWKYEFVDNRWTKVPYQSDAIHRASTDESKTWCDIATAVNAFLAGKGDGIGFVLTGSGLVGVDFDDIKQPGRAARAAQWINEFASYAETSPSNNGFHIICKGTIPKGSRNAAEGLEIYNKGRYFCMTGDVFSNQPITDAQPVIDRFLAQYFTPKEKPEEPRRSQNTNMDMGDYAVLKRMFNSKNGNKILDLYNGRFQEGQHSEADMALLGYLYFWTAGNQAQSFYLFGESALGKRDKWAEREDYRLLTWNAVAHGPVWEGRHPSDNGHVDDEYAEDNARTRPDTPTEEEEEPTTIADRLASLKFNIHTPPPLETAVFQTDDGATIATRGNISTLTAQAKAGKTAFMAAMGAAAITPRPDECDLLGIRALNPDNLPILILDTEHSPHHHHLLCDRILRRAMLTESNLLHAYRLAGFSVAELNDFLEYLLAQQKWLAAFIDGIGDFVIDVNDPKESNRFIAHLHGLSIHHDTHILNVLHLNPSSEFKSRGHLGSQLERKSETNLRMEKIDEVSIVFADKNRGASIPKSDGPRFSWSDDKLMHTSVDFVPSAPKGGRPNKIQEIASSNLHAFCSACTPEGEGKNQIARRLELFLASIHIDLSERTCKSIIEALVANQKLTKNEASFYVKGPQA